MITQKIKGWLQKLFAWWPWKQSTPTEYQHVTSVVTRGPSTEASSWPKLEGTAPQSGAVPRLSTLEDQSERVIRPRSEASDSHSLALPASPINKDTESVTDSDQTLSATPTTQQRRLEFLRYLVQRGIVNEGIEKQEEKR